MKVVCINKYLSTHLQYELTYGKIYEVLPKLHVDLLMDDYRIKCDRGEIHCYIRSDIRLINK